MKRYLLLPLLVLSACDPGQPDDAGSDVSADDAIDYPTYLARSIRANCAAIYDCCSPADRAILGAADWPDYDTCVATTEAVIAEHGNAMELIDSGAILFDGTAAAHCVAELESATCRESIDARNRFYEGPCANVGRGTAPLGADCSDGRAVACASGFCDDGVCTALPTLGQPCDAVLCDGGVCSVGGFCEALALEGAPCMRDMQCEVGLYCAGEDWGTSTPGACAPIDHCLGT